MPVAPEADAVRVLLRLVAGTRSWITIIHPSVLNEVCQKLVVNIGLLTTLANSTGSTRPKMYFAKSVAVESKSFG